MHKSILALVVLTSALGCVAAVQQYQQETAGRVASEAHRGALIEQFAVALEDYFLFPEIGRRYAAARRTKAAAGGYASYARAASFAEAVTRDLQQVHPDGHLRLRAPVSGQRGGVAGGGNAEDASAETGIEKAAWLADGIAYLGLELFPGTDASLAALRAALERHASARTLVIDLRTHGGGYTEEIDLLSAYLFAEPTVLVHMETRAVMDRGKPDTATVKRVEAPPGLLRQAHIAVPGEQATALRSARVYVLTSGYTGSAAEHLALALKRTGRATLIGETTAGAGHYGKIVELPGGFPAFIPVGRTFDPDTGDGWEGTGVAPHHQVPAERALYEALTRSGLPAAEARQISSRTRPRESMERIVPLRKPAASG
ncbi:MAG TPA: S41 family peptidase [Thermoanaerobaculia bacterium]|nr:S41 family peptidase [Thermoanaerobaculia bacterium]